DKERLMDILAHELERLDRLITDIASTSKLHTELSREKPERVSLKALIEDLLNRNKDPLQRDQDAHCPPSQPSQSHWDEAVSVAGKSICVESAIRHDIILLSIAPRLMQVFENLISNALSFSPEGGVIRIKITAQDKTVKIEICDEGKGIPLA